MSEDKKPKKTIAVTQDGSDEPAGPLPRIEVAQRSVLKAPSGDAPTQPGAPEVKRTVSAKDERTETEPELSAPLMEIANRAKRVKEEAEASQAKAGASKEAPDREESKKPGASEPTAEAAADRPAAPKTPADSKAKVKPPAEISRQPEAQDQDQAEVTTYDSIGDKDKADAEAEAVKAAQAPVDDAAAKQAAEHEAAMQKLVDSKQYHLPIKTVEQRRSRRVVIVGTLLSIILVLAWVNIALDAGLIELGDIKPVTRFFSN